MVPQPSYTFINVSFKTANYGYSKFARNGRGKGVPFEVGIYSHKKKSDRPGHLAKIDPSISFLAVLKTSARVTTLSATWPTMVI